jgi:hypothetical protein
MVPRQEGHLSLRRSWRKISHQTLLVNDFVLLPKLTSGREFCLVAEGVAGSRRRMLNSPAVPPCAAHRYGTPLIRWSDDGASPLAP